MFFCEIAILLKVLICWLQNIYVQIAGGFFFGISNILKAMFPSGPLGLRNVVWHSDKRMVENKSVEVLKGMKKSGIILCSLHSLA